MNHLGFPVKVLRTDRIKSASICIEENEVRVIVPRNLSDDRVDSLLKKRAPWIKRKLHELSQIPPVKAKEFVNGESFSYLGRNYRLKVLPSESSGVKFRNGRLEVSLPDSFKHSTRQNHIRLLLIQWYQKQALIRLKEKTKRFSEMLNVEPTSVSIRNYKSMWGSCSARGEINYNWRIMMAPHHIIDYIVVHELCHLIEHNHSRTFWLHVQKIISSYKSFRKWLKVNGESLQI